MTNPLFCGPFLGGRGTATPGPPIPPEEPPPPPGTPAIVENPGTIAGLRGNGNTISGTVPSVSGDPEPTVSFAWEVYEDTEWLTLPGETDETYTDTSATEEMAIRRRVTATNTAGSDTDYSNELDGLATPTGVPVITDPGTISGTRGGLLTGTSASATGDPAPVLAYQWQSQIDFVWTNISGATAQNFTDTPTTEEYPIRRRVAATNSEGAATDYSNILQGSGGSSEEFEFITQPAFVQPDGDGGFEPADPVVGENVLIYLTAGEVSGGAPPLQFEFAILDHATGDPIFARTDEPEFTLDQDLVGTTIRGRVWCVDDENNEIVADTAPLGPLTAGFVSEVILSLPLRETLAYVTDEFAEDTPIAMADGWAYPIVRNGRNVGWYNSQPTSSNRSTAAGSRLAGSANFNNSSRRVRLDVPNGAYTLFLGMRTTSTFTGRLEVWDGDPDADGILITTIDGIASSDGSGNCRDATNAVRTTTDWRNASPDNCGAGLAITITKGSLRFRRSSAQSSTELAPLNFVRLRTREA